MYTMYNIAVKTSTCVTSVVLFMILRDIQDSSHIATRVYYQQIITRRNVVLRILIAQSTVRKGTAKAAL